MKIRLFLLGGMLLTCAVATSQERVSVEKERVKTGHAEVESTPSSASTGHQNSNKVYTRVEVGTKKGEVAPGMQVKDLSLEQVNTRLDAYQKKYDTVTSDPDQMKKPEMKGWKEEMERQIKALKARKEELEKAK